MKILDIDLFTKLLFQIIDMKIVKYIGNYLQNIA